jgi:uncharacterized membrane protein (UPF0136 family)
MMEAKLSAAELMLIAGTRIALGVGIGLLIAGRLDRDSRKAVGIALTVVGGMTTVPLVLQVVSKQKTGELRSAA